MKKLDPGVYLVSSNESEVPAKKRPWLYERNFLPISSLCSFELLGVAKSVLPFHPDIKILLLKNHF